MTKKMFEDISLIYKFMAQHEIATVDEFLKTIEAMDKTLKILLEPKVPMEVTVAKDGLEECKALDNLSW